VRKRWMCLLVIGLVGMVVATCGGTTTVSKMAVERLDELNRILDEIIEGMDSLTLGQARLIERLEDAMTAFTEVLAAMPVAGLLFSDVFSALYDIQYALNNAAEIIDSEMSLSPYSLYLAFRDARRAKDSLEWAASGGLVQQQLGCTQGKALVMVYPGFDCHALRAKLNELRAAGKCVTLGWKEPVCYAPDPNVAFDGPTARQLFDCLGISYPVGPTFEWDALVEPGARGFSESHTFGDPSGDCHVSQTPRSVHETYVDSTLALDVSGGEPTRYDPNRPFSVGDVLKPWYKVEDVCSPLDVEWLFYGPAGTPAYIGSSTLDPADYNTDCLSSFSSAGWVTLDRSSFGMAGTYTAELWLGGTHCANHTFQMADSGNRPPYVNDDLYIVDEDAALEVQDYGVLANDFDPNSDPLTTTVDEGPRHGTLALNPDGTFAYTPVTDYYGIDWFTYRAADPGGLYASGEVTILVNPVNDPPIVSDDVFDLSVSPEQRIWTVSVPSLDWSDTGTFTEDGVFVDIPAPGVLINDSDPDGDPLSVVSDGLPTPVSLAVSGDGSLAIHIPDPGDLHGVFPVSYHAVDPAGLGSTGQIVIRILRQEGGG